MIMQQRTTPGGHTLTGEADLMDGHAVFEQTWMSVTEDPNDGTPPRVVDSVLVGQRVWLNEIPVRDPARAIDLWAEAMRTR
jgi:hypothetical protein